MIIDESSAKMALKKKVNVLLHRKEILAAKKNPVKKSRRQWAKNMLEMIEWTSIIIGFHQKDKYHINLIVLFPYKESFRICSVQLDAKKIDMSINKMTITFTEHFFVRMMQSKKTIKFSNLVEDLNLMLNIILSLSSNRQISSQCREYGIYADQLGFIPILYDKRKKQSEVLIKTIIPPQVMGLKHLNNYDAVKGKGTHQVVRAY